MAFAVFLRHLATTTTNAEPLDPTYMLNCILFWHSISICFVLF